MYLGINLFFTALVLLICISFQPMSISEKEAVFTSFDTLNSSYLGERAIARRASLDQQMKMK